MTVGYVGAFEYSMALDQAVVAAEQLPEVNFVLVGAGRDLAHIRAEVDRLALKNVTLTGALPHDEAMRRIDGMDICLNLFHKTRVSHAVSPLKLFEYLSHGKPVISTRLHEVERINEGFLFFADDAGEVVERIRYIAGHRDEAERMAFRGREIVARSFSWPVIAAKFLEAVTS
jgi:glycosyltransferase involved in cell wall biosynthesis